jgi:hypothetical protein
MDVTGETPVITGAIFEIRGPRDRMNSSRARFSTNLVPDQGIRR